MKSVRYGDGVAKVYEVTAEQIDYIKSQSSDESTASLLGRLIAQEAARLGWGDELKKLYGDLKAAQAEVKEAQEAAAFWEKATREVETRERLLWNYYLVAIGRHPAAEQWIQEQDGHPDWIADYLPE